MVAEELVHRHQLDRGDVERFQVVDDHGVREAGVGAAQLLGYAGVRLRHSLDVRLVDDRLVIRRAGSAIRAPLEERVDHDAGHGVAEGVDVWRLAAGDQIVGFEIEGVQRLGELEFAVERLAVRVEQQLARIAAVPRRRAPRPVYPEAVALTGSDRRQVAVPHVTVDLLEVDAVLAAVLADQAQLDSLGDLGEQ